MQKGGTEETCFRFIYLRAVRDWLSEKLIELLSVTQFSESLRM